MYRYYQILQLPTTASLVDVKKAYRRLAHEYHPDVSTDPDANEKFVELNEAYEYLLNKIKLEEDLRKSKSAFTDETAQSVIDAWLISEQERMRARARKHAAMRYKKFQESELYRSSDPYSFTLIIIAFTIGTMVLFGASYGTWDNIINNPIRTNNSYIGSTIILFIMGFIMVGFAFRQLMVQIRIRKSSK